jgi:hypothetical protein
MLDNLKDKRYVRVLAVNAYVVVNVAMYRASVELARSVVCE